MIKKEKPMLNKLHMFTERIGTLKRFILFIVLYIAFYIIFFSPVTPIGSYFLSELPVDQPVLDLRYGYTPDAAYGYIDTLGMSGRFAYIRNLLVLDYVHPLLYALFVSSLTAYLFMKIKPRFEWVKLLSLVPFVPMLCDFIENVLLIVLVNNYPDQMPVVVHVTGGLTIAKLSIMNWTFIFILIQLVWLIVKSVVRAIQRRKI